MTDDKQASQAASESASDTIEVDLKNPWLAALFAWLWPGAGHIYQGRYAKGLLFMVCILGTFFFGLFMGEGKVVYASWNKEDKRWEYAFQIGVGLPALPAYIQYRRALKNQDPVFEAMRPPRDAYERSQWHSKLNSAFELGTLFTMIAGLLNVLAIYDAYAGPFVPEPDENSQRPPPDAGRSRPSEPSQPTESRTREAR